MKRHHSFDDSEEPECEKKELVLLDDIRARRTACHDFLHFHRQANALQWMTQNKLHGAIWAKDKPVRKPDGEMKMVKTYYVTGYKKMFERLQSMPEKERNFYEMIFMGATRDDELHKGKKIGEDGKKNLCSIESIEAFDKEYRDRMAICHLHVDLDVNRVANPDVDFENLFPTYMNELISFYRAYFNLENEPKILMSDSSNEMKWSRHAVVKDQEYMFKSSADVGCFMQRFHFNILERYGSPEKNIFYVKKGKKNKEGEEIYEFVFDETIYTRWRVFRLLFNAKKGSERFLYPMKPWLNGVRSIHDITFAQFLESLVQYSEKPRVFLFSILDFDGLSALYTSKKLMTRIFFDDDGKCTFNPMKSTHITNYHPARIQQTCYDWYNDQMTELFESGRFTICKPVADFAGELMSKAAHDYDSRDEIATLNVSRFFFYGISRVKEIIACPHKGIPHKSNNVRYRITLVNQLNKFEPVRTMSCMDSADCMHRWVQPKKLTKDMLGEKLWERMEAYVGVVFATTNISTKELSVLWI